MVPDIHSEGQPSIQDSQHTGKLSGESKLISKLKEKMTHEKAEKILKFIAGFPESSISDLRSLSEIEEYSPHDVQEALIIYSREIIGLHGERSRALGLDAARKKTAKGELELNVFWKVSNGLTLEYPKSISLEYFDKNITCQHQLYCNIPLHEGSFTSSVFEDTRTVERLLVSAMHDMKKDHMSSISMLDLDTYRHVWRGFRWMCANLLEWNGDFKYPEDIDHLPISPVQGEQFTKLSSG